jgi:hypothetical protein
MDAKTLGKRAGIALVGKKVLGKLTRTGFTLAAVAAIAKVLRGGVGGPVGGQQPASPKRAR